MAVDTSQIKVILKKATAINSKPTEETFPELPTVLIWIRFVLAVVYGTYIGHVGMRGGAALLHTLNLIAFIPVMYCRLYLGAEVDAYGMKILTSGLLPALTLAMLIWIYMFTVQNPEAEAKLAAMLVATLLPNENDPSDHRTSVNTDNTGISVDTSSEVEEPEF
jgi:hypothetical protein